MLFLCLSALLIFKVVHLNAESCTTPDGKPGECVFIDFCPSLFGEFKYPVNETKEPLSKYVCGKTFDHVCCSSPKNSSTTTGNELSDLRYCGYQHTDDYYSATNSTSIDEYPWLAAIMATTPNSKEIIACQGAIINKRYILTTAQCFVGDSSTYYNITRVLLGEYHVKTDTDCVDLSQFDTTECSKTESYDIAETIVHPFYKEEGGLNDIALLRLHKKIYFSDYIRPICLPIEGTKFAQVGDSLYTTGWGKVSNTGDTAIIKKKIKTILITQEECQKRYVTEIISISHMCTLDSRTNSEYSCIGDAGAPVMFSYRSQWHIEGLASKGNVCAELPGIHTKVSSYLKWIKHNIKD